MDLNGTDVVNSREFAQMLGIKSRTVINYLSRERKAGWPNLGKIGKFPKPLGYVEGHPVWRRDDATNYAANRLGGGWHEKGDDRIARYMLAAQSAE